MSHAPDNMREQVKKLGRQARAASLGLAILSSERKNTILLAMASAVEDASTSILSANTKDLAAAAEAGLSSAMLDRLRLDQKAILTMADGIRHVATLPDPVGEILRDWTRPNGLRIRKRRTPIGVIGIIYESRPNVTADAAVLCLKTGNATILRGGKEAIHSNVAIAAALASGGASAGLPEHSIQLIPFTDRESVRYLCEMDDCLDLIIPRGGAGLIEAVVGMARMPVIKHYDGICHIYVDRAADLDMAEAIVINAKMAKPSACNAAETLLIHREVAAKFAPKIAESLTAKNAELRADPEFIQLVSDAGIALGTRIVPAEESDWRTEYLDYILSVRIVADLDEAIAHINTYGSRHSDTIVTADAAAAERFQLEVDAACVFWNASTRFNDGAEFGFGAEIGISTDKLHARGPMGLEELCSYKYLLDGNGQVR